MESRANAATQANQQRFVVCMNCCTFGGKLGFSAQLSFRRLTRLRRVCPLFCGNSDRCRSDRARATVAQHYHYIEGPRLGAAPHIIHIAAAHILNRGVAGRSYHIAIAADQIALIVAVVTNRDSIIKSIGVDVQSLFTHHKGVGSPVRYLPKRHFTAKEREPRRSRGIGPGREGF